MKAVLWERERASGLIGGVDYGSSVRVLARTPTDVVFSGSGGLHLVKNWKSGYGVLRREYELARGRISRALIDKAKDRLEELVGEGAYQAVRQAWEAGRTALIDGGGDPLPVPRAQWIVEHDARRAVEAPPWRADLSARLPRCKQCDASLHVSTDHHRLGYKITADHPKTAEDCQRMTNSEVVAIHRYPDAARWAYVEWFEVWNGQAVLEIDFCNDKCAAAYGRRAARDLPPLEPTGETPAGRVHRVREDVEHNPQPEREFMTRCGEMMKV